MLQPKGCLESGGDGRGQAEAGRPLRAPAPSNFRQAGGHPVDARGAPGPQWAAAPVLGWVAWSWRLTHPEGTSWLTQMERGTPDFREGCFPGPLGARGRRRMVRGTVQSLPWGGVGCQASGTEHKRTGLAADGLWKLAQTSNLALSGYLPTQSGLPPPHTHPGSPSPQPSCPKGPRVPQLLVHMLCCQRCVRTPPPSYCIDPAMSRGFLIAPWRPFLHQGSLLGVQA